MNQRLPLLAILLGIAGLIPFVVCGLGAIVVNPARAQAMLWGLMGYGAVVLSFLGAVHWGFALGQPEGGLAQSARAERLRLTLGVIPALVGWAALFSTLALPSWIGLCLLIGGFIGTAITEHRATRHGLVPLRYMWMRWGLTAVVVAMLVTVLTLRVLGQRTGF
ncbi:MAG: DUF3429 domain-containing protein [Acetobacteraceae bacterium]|nr:DUF3429 domain-containing protein [Acetobacteraceae bacterium]